MAFSFGFYNSSKGDRLYDSVDIARIFDGVITDGVFAGIGDLFAVTPGAGLQIGVGSGKAWFNHTWNRNDNIYLMPIGDADITLSRIDLVYLKVDSRDSVRANSLEIRKGEPAVEPQKPQLIQNPDDGVHEHALAYVTVRPASTQIEARDIEIVVGTEETPFVTSILQQTDIDSLWQNWKSQFTEFIETSDTEMDEWMLSTRGEFDEWWDAIKATLDTETATRLQNQIDELKNGKLDSNHASKINAHQVGFGNLVKTNVPLYETANCNTQLDPFYVMNGSTGTNSPGLGYWYIQTFGLGHVAGGTVAQIAYPYNDISRPLRFRNCYSGSWTQWTDILTTSKIHEILSSPGASNRIGDIHTTLRTDMGSAWKLCDGQLFSEVEYPNAKAIVDPNLERWPSAKIIPIPYFVPNALNGPSTAYNGSGTYAIIAKVSAGSVTLNYGNNLEGLSNSKTITVPSNGYACALLYSSKIGWVLAYRTGSSYQTTVYLLKATDVAGDWSLIGGSCPVGNQTALIYALLDGTVICAASYRSSYYCSDGVNLKKVGGDSLAGSIYAVGYLAGKYYFIYQNSSDLAMYYSTNLTTPPATKVSGVTLSGFSYKFFDFGSELLYLNSSSGELLSISGTSGRSVSIPELSNEYSELRATDIVPVIANGKRYLLLARSVNEGSLHKLSSALLKYDAYNSVNLLRYNETSVSYAFSANNIENSSIFLGDKYLSVAIGIFKIGPCVPKIDAVEGNAYILLKELFG